MVAADEVVQDAKVVIVSDGDDEDWILYRIIDMG